MGLNQSLRDRFRLLLRGSRHQHHTIARCGRIFIHHLQLNPKFSRILAFRLGVGLVDTPKQINQGISQSMTILGNELGNLVPTKLNA
jgi:hypothetical protein